MPNFGGVPKSVGDEVAAQILILSRGCPVLGRRSNPGVKLPISISHYLGVRAVRLWKFAALAALILGVFGSTNCTRQTSPTKFNIRVPVSSGVVGLTNINLEVGFASITINGGKPILQQKETHDEDAPPTPYGQTVEFVVPEVKGGDSVFIQVLLVYRDFDNGNMTFYYAEEKRVIQGVTIVDMTAQASGTSTREAEIAGQFLTAASTGPTGTLGMYFHKPGYTPMLIEKRPIVNGWFQAFAVQGAAIDYKILESGLTLFDDLTIDASGNLERNIAGTQTDLTYGNYRLAMLKPASFSSEHGSVQARAASLLVLGYFDNEATLDSLANISAHKVVFPTNSQGLPGSYATAAMTSILDYTGASGSAADVHKITGGGGIADSLGNIYTDGVTGCYQSNVAAGDCLIFHSWKLGRDGGSEGFSGMSVPFTIQRPFATSEGFIVSQFMPSGCSGADCTRIKWNLLPMPAPVKQSIGIEVWAKYSSGGGGDDGGGDRKCEELAGQGYSLKGTTDASVQSYFDVTGVTSSDHYNWQYQVCAKISTAEGPKYINRPMHVDCADCGGFMDHLGWAQNTGNLGIGSSQFHNAFDRVNGTPNASNSIYTQVPVTNSSPPFSPNDEVMIHVSGMRGSSTCGSSGGMTVQPGMAGFARVIYVGANDVKISKGTFLDSLTGVSGTDLQAVTNSSGTNFCYIQLAKVLHYHDVTLSSSAMFGVGTFAYGGAGGGILPLRVSGKLELGDNSYIYADGSGYPGGTTGQYGGGHDIANNGSVASNNGGQSGSGSGFGGGGGGYGHGGRDTGDGASGSGGSGVTSGSMDGMRFMFGGGGGGALSNSGYNGGGIIFLMANKIVAGDNTRISANGSGFAGYGGAGGGGSVFVFARKMARLSGATDDLKIQAVGGGASTGGGVGGGGTVSDHVCSNPDPLSVLFDAGKGTMGEDDGAAAQDGQHWTSTSSDDWMCKN